MKQNRILPAPLEEFAPEDGSVEDSRPFKTVHLRLLMKEREDAVSRLVQLDYRIWVLEEFFRAGVSG